MSKAKASKRPKTNVEPKKASKFKVSMEFLMSSSAMIAAAAAVVVAVVQTNIMKEEAEMEREHARLSVQPSIWFFRRFSTGDEPNFAFLVQNKGLGPAIVEQFEIKVDGETVLHWNDVVEKVSEEKFHLKGESRVEGSSYSSIPTGHVVQAGEEIRPYRLIENGELVRLLANASGRIEISACACSVYKECWQTTGLGERPLPVKMCVYDPKTFFRGF